MEDYIIGLKLDGLTYMDIDDTSISDIKNSNVVIVLSSDSSDKLSIYYTKIRNLIINNNRIILILDGSKSKIRKTISMLLASYRKYDIYTIDDISIVDREYINSLIKRNPSEEEVSTFIGSDVTAYSDIDSIILDLSTLINNNNLDGVRELIENKRDSIENFVDLINYMKLVVDKHSDANSRIKELKDKITKLEDSLNDTNKQLNNAIRDAKDAKAEKDMLQKEAFQAKQKKAELEEQLNSREPVIRTYTEVQTQMIKCRTKVIIYFKEISHISYISSLVTRFIETLVKLKKLKVKLMIYDNKHSFLNSYNPIPIVGSTEYINNRDIVVNKYEKIVAVEANQALVEDVLTSDWDVVIIYDRLRQANDIVSGNNVYKYWVLNSVTEYTALKKAFKIEKDRIITRPGLFPESLSIQSIPGYKSHTVSAKLADYVNMKNIGDNKPIFETLINTTNINAIHK